MTFCLLNNGKIGIFAILKDTEESKEAAGKEGHLGTQAVDAVGLALDAEDLSSEQGPVLCPREIHSAEISCVHGKRVLFYFFECKGNGFYTLLSAGFNIWVIWRETLAPFSLLLKIRFIFWFSRRYGVLVQTL